MSSTRRLFAIAVMIGLGGPLGGCGGGALPGGDAGSRGGAGGAIGTGTGGGSAATGGGGDPFTECARPQPAPRMPPNIVVALDGSRAMAEALCAGCGPASRWTSATEAIAATVQDTQDEVKWGLALFGDDGSTCGASDVVDVGVALGTAGPITDALARQTAMLGPTSVADRQVRRAVLTATRHLMSSGYDPSFIVLVSAGAPSCAADTAAAITDDTGATVDAIRAASVGGIGTFVVGLGTFDAAANASMENIASAGNPNLTGPVPNYFIALSAGEVQAALRTVVHATEGCTFRMPPATNQLADIFNLSVFFGDTSIERDPTHTEGWDFVDSSQQSFRFFGAACDAARANRAELPIVKFGCPAV